MGGYKGGRGDFPSGCRGRGRGQELWLTQGGKDR